MPFAKRWQGSVKVLQQEAIARAQNIVDRFEIIVSELLHQLIFLAKLEIGHIQQSRIASSSTDTY